MFNSNWNTMVQLYQQKNLHESTKLPAFSDLVKSLCTCPDSTIGAPTQLLFGQSGPAEFVWPSSCTSNSEYSHLCAFHHPKPEQSYENIHQNSPEKWSTSSNTSQPPYSFGVAEYASSREINMTFPEDDLDALTTETDDFRPYKWGWFDPETFLCRKIIHWLENQSPQVLSESFFSQTTQGKYGTSFKAVQNSARDPSNAPHPTKERRRRDRHRNLNGLAHSCVSDLLRRFVSENLSPVINEMRTEFAEEDEGSSSLPSDQPPISTLRIGAHRTANSDSTGKDEQCFETWCLPYFAALAIQEEIHRSNELVRIVRDLELKLEMVQRELYERTRACNCGSSTALSSPVRLGCSSPTSSKRSFEESNLRSTRDMPEDSRVYFGTFDNPHKRRVSSETICQCRTQLRCKL